MWDFYRQAQKSKGTIPDPLIEHELCLIYGWTQRQIEEDFTSGFWDDLIKAHSIRVEEENKRIEKIWKKKHGR